MRESPAAVQRQAPIGQHLLQRKEGQCACGGGCPRCTAMSLQRKAQVSAPGDRFEREADEVADQVMRMPDSMVQRQCKACSDASTPRPSDEGEPQIQRRANGEGGTSKVASDFTNRLGAGVPLDTASRSYFEPRFGHDFDNVRIHNGPQADRAASSIQARAFTLGRDVVFAAGEHDPGSEGGKRLLAHELTHVVQQGGRIGRKIQRQVVTQRNGHTVGIGTSDNIREEVLNTLDRLHELWSISNPDYAIEYPHASGFAAGSSIPATALTATINAIRKNEQPDIHHAVARNFLGINLTAPVGTGAINNKSDASLLQTILKAHALLSVADFTTENGAVIASTAATVNAALFPRTLLALTDLKQQIAGGRMGWAPIHADERRYGPEDDRFGARTFNFNNLSIFIPSGAAATTSNKVHVFFSPGDVQGQSGLNAVLHHGLRGASDASEWILIGVPGAQPGFVSISTSEIQDCLRFIGRTAPIDDLRLSAHSRGYRGLAETIRRSLVNTSIISRVVIFDANYSSAASALTGSGIPASRIIAYDVGSGTLGVSGSTTYHLNPNCMRAIGYSRLISDAMITRPSLVIPPVIRSQLLTLPPRGNFTTLASPVLPMVNINDFCRTNRASITTMISNETNATTGLKTFLDTNNLGRLGSAFSAGIYSHHFFVTELAHEVTD